MKKLNKGVRVSQFLLAFTFFLLVVNSCGPKKEEVIQHYATGEVSRKHTLIHGKKEGEMVEYFKDGKVKGIRMFRNDQQVDKGVFYYPNGNIQEAQYFADGKLNGGDTVFYENGKPQFLRNFNKGKLDGYIRKWNTDGSVIYEAKYSNDTLVEVKGESVRTEHLLQK